MTKRDEQIMNVDDWIARTVQVGDQWGLLVINITTGEAPRMPSDGIKLPEKELTDCSFDGFKSHETAQQEAENVLKSKIGKIGKWRAVSSN